MKETFEIGVREVFHKGRTQYRAYMKWFDPKGPGCCFHRVTIDPDTDHRFMTRQEKAKWAALREHRLHCLEKAKP